MDTALRTADSGYLTRRLVDVCQDVIVREADCGTDQGIPLQALMDGDKVVVPLEERLVGRVLAQDVVHPQTQEILARRNQEVDHDLAKTIVEAGIQQVIVRSPLPVKPTARCAACATAGAWPTLGWWIWGGGRDHCRPIDWRAGHAVDHAHLPHGRVFTGRWLAKSAPPLPG